MERYIPKNGVGIAEQPDQRALDQQINRMTGSSQEDYDRMWQSSNFCIAFPGIVQYLISPSGLQQITPVEREVIFKKTLTSFGRLPWDTRKADAIPAQRLAFSKDGEIISWGSLESLELENTADTLIRTEIACVLLLAMSLPDQDPVKKEIANFHKNLKGIRKETFRNHLGHLIDLKGISRAWIKTNRLDMQTVHEWDGWLVGLLVSLPEYAIDRAEKPPPNIPPECSFVLIERFSREAATAFLQHLWLYSNIFPLNDNKHTKIMDFLIDLQAYGDDFIHSEPVWPMFKELEDKINQHFPKSIEELEEDENLS